MRYSKPDPLDDLWQEGCQGNVDDYYDPRNSYVNEVVDRKLGSISLRFSTGPWPNDWDSLWRASTCLVASCSESAGRMPVIFVGPFHGGAASLDREGCCRTLSGLLGKPTKLTDLQLARSQPRAGGGHGCSAT